MLPLALCQAATTMLSGRPGPVNIDIPFNLFQEEANVEIEPPSGGHNLRRSGAAPDDVSIAVDKMLAAERPVLFIGHGVNLSEAAEELESRAAQADSADEANDPEAIVEDEEEDGLEQDDFANAEPTKPESQG